MQTRDIMTGGAALQMVTSTEVLARDIMTGGDALQTILSSGTLADAAGKMREHKVSALPVVDEDRRVVGMISERDLASKCEQESKTESFKTFHSPLAWLTSESPAGDVDRLMQDLSAVGRMSVNEAMTTDVVMMDEEDSVGTLLQRMAEREVNHIPVVSGERLTGIVARRDVLSALSNLATETPETT